MSDAPTPPAFAPQAPFNDPSRADVILRSSDGADFHVYRVVLSLASPVFQHMFTSPQPKSEPLIPVVQMAEGGVLLDRMLRFVYPGADLVVDSLSQLREVLEQLRYKYEAGSVVPLGKQCLKGYIESQPLGSFAVAARHDWRDIAAMAAKECLRLPLRCSKYASPDELRYLPATAFHDLLQYHYACGHVARQAIVNFSWIGDRYESAYPWFSQSCSCLASNVRCEGYPLPIWIVEYFRGMATVFTETPAATEVDEHPLMAKAIEAAQKCKQCQPEASTLLPKLTSNKWWPHVNSEIAKIQLNLTS